LRQGNQPRQFVRNFVPAPGSPTHSEPSSFSLALRAAGAMLLPTMPLPKYLLPATFSVSLMIAAIGSAQTAAPAADTAAAPTPATAATTSAPSADTSAPASTAAAAASAASGGTGRGRAGRGGRAGGTGRGAGTGAAAAAAPAGPPAPWDRPADGPVMFNEDFESGAINPKVWVTRVAGDATISVEQDVVAHGKNALHVHYPAGTRTNSWAFIGLTVPEALRDHFYGRAYVSINGIPATHSVYMLAGSIGFPIADFLEIGTDRGLFQPSFQLNAPTADRQRSETTHQVGNYPVGKWFCLEWEFIEANKDHPGRIVIWVDGKLTVNQTITHRIMYPDGGLTGGFFEYDIGFRTWANPAPNDIDIYYDDVAYSDKPIGQLAPVAAPAASNSTSPDEILRVQAATMAPPATSAASPAPATASGTAAK